LIKACQNAGLGEELLARHLPRGVGLAGFGSQRIADDDAHGFERAQPARQTQVCHAVNGAHTALADQGFHPVAFAHDAARHQDVDHTQV
jgi:hypothetical protein